MKKITTLLAITVLLITKAYSQNYEQRGVALFSAISLNKSAVSVNSRNYKYTVEGNGGTGLTLGYGFLISEKNNVYIVPRIDFNSLSVHTSTAPLDSIDNAIYSSQTIDMFAVGLSVQKIFEFTEKIDLELGVSTKLNTVTILEDPDADSNSNNNQTTPTKTALSSEFYSPIVFGANFGFNYFYDEDNRLGVYFGYGVNMLSSKISASKRLFMHNVAVGLTCRLD